MDRDSLRVDRPEGAGRSLALQSNSRKLNQGQLIACTTFQVAILTWSNKSSFPAVTIMKILAFRLECIHWLCRMKRLIAISKLSCPHNTTAGEIMSRFIRFCMLSTSPRLFTEEMDYVAPGHLGFIHRHISPSENVFLTGFVIEEHHDSDT